LRQLLQQVSWQQELDQLPGYQAGSGGAVHSLRAELPWWALKPKKT
jgi:hypothetical protein